MVATITAGFCCRSPLTDLLKLFAVLCTLLLQYLKQLIEGMVRDFAPPQAFHASKVQGFKKLSKLFLYHALRRLHPAS